MFWIFPPSAVSIAVSYFFLSTWIRSETTPSDPCCALLLLHDAADAAVAASARNIFKDPDDCCLWYCATALSRLSDWLPGTCGFHSRFLLIHSGSVFSSVLRSTRSPHRFLLLIAFQNGGKIRLSSVLRASRCAASAAPCGCSPTHHRVVAPAVSPDGCLAVPPTVR